MKKYKPPLYNQTSFNCPHANCGAFAQQEWRYGCSRVKDSHDEAKSLKIVYCSHCQNYSIWIGDKMVYPEMISIEVPNDDLDKDIKDDFNEARAIMNKSPRGAVALLRLCVQKLCKQLGESGKNINDDIAQLVEKGLSEKIQQALDIVRVVGNNAVHPGQIDLKDDIQIAKKLFGLLNMIAQVMITQPKEVEYMFQSLPPEQKEAIEVRDGV